jgi:hypothetical protein
MRKSASDQLKSLWKSWVRVAHWIGNFQARVLLTILYTVVLFPFGICVRLFSDPLRTKQRPANCAPTTCSRFDAGGSAKQ